MSTFANTPFCERMRDILDSLALGQINKDEAVKQLSDLTSDYHDAHAIIRTTEPNLKDMT